MDVGDLASSGETVSQRSQIAWLYIARVCQQRRVFQKTIGNSGSDGAGLVCDIYSKNQKRYFLIIYL